MGALSTEDFLKVYFVEGGRGWTSGDDGGRDTIQHLRKIDGGEVSTFCEFQILLNRGPR